MEIFYKTLKLEIENDRKILDFAMNKLKEKWITFSLLPFVDEETSTTYNPATKTTQTSTSYTDTILITLSKNIDWENKAFSKEELAFIDALNEFIEDEKFNEDKEKYEEERKERETELFKNVSQKTPPRTDYTNLLSEEALAFSCQSQPSR